ncbi:hypothetical protein D3C78_19150 [compost metagenome]
MLPRKQVVVGMSLSTCNKICPYNSIVVGSDKTMTMLFLYVDKNMNLHVRLSEVVDEQIGTLLLQRKIEQESFLSTSRQVNEVADVVQCSQSLHQAVGKYLKQHPSLEKPYKLKLVTNYSVDFPKLLKSVLLSKDGTEIKLKRKSNKESLTDMIVANCDLVLMISHGIFTVILDYDVIDSC